MEEEKKEQNEEFLTDFEFKLNYKNIYKNSFLTNFPNSIKNIITIKQDNQGCYWNNFRSRSNTLSSVLNISEGFRCVEMENKEKELKQIYKSIKKYDDMYQFKNCIKVGTTHIFHFQIRKNILQKKNNLIYNKKYSIEIYDTIKNKKQTLINFDDSQVERIICYDVYFDDEKILTCIGNNTGDCDIFSVKENDFINCMESKNLYLVPSHKKNISLLTAERLLHNNGLNNSGDYEEVDLFINYVKFISDNKLLTTSNDCYFKINDLNKNISEQKYKNEFPINHCDLNIDKNLLLCIGDSKSIIIVDLKTNKKIYTLDEHFDYGLVIKFNPYNNFYFASGNQDNTCKIWDIIMLNKGSFLTSWGIHDNIGDLDWINSNTLCYMENSFFSHIFDIKNDKIQDLVYYGKGNGVVHDKLNDYLYINVYNGNQDDPSGILCYETLKNKVFNSFNNINL